MKIIYFTIINILVLCFLACMGDGDEGIPAKECNQPELEIKNCSEYIIKALYIHDTKDYSTSDSVLTATMDPAATDSLTVTRQMNDGEEKYITFIRDLTTTSGPEIGVTTSNPVLFEECYNYRLNILEEDFLLERSNNSTPVNDTTEAIRQSVTRIQIGYPVLP